MQVRNPVMFVVEVGSVLTTGLWIQALVGKGEAPTWFIGAVAIWLWFTVIFANFSEALAEGRGKAQAEALRQDPQRNQRQETGKTTRQRTAPLELYDDSIDQPAPGRLFTWLKPAILSPRMAKWWRGLPR